MSYSEDILRASQADLPWSTLYGRKVLVVGATGLIGGCVVELLMAHTFGQFDVYASGRNRERAVSMFARYSSNPRFHFIEYDVTERLMSDVCFDYIVDAASNASPNFFASKPVEVIKANMSGVANLIEYGIAHSMTRFVYISTGEVYGEGDGRVFTEDYSGYVNILSPRSCYPSSKRAAETLCMAYCAEYGADCVVVRPSHTYGPHFTESDNRVYAQFIRNVINGEDIVMKSDGAQFRSWCYVVDCASAILYAMLKGDKGSAYNIADSDSNISVRQLAEMIADIGGKKVVIDLPSNAEKKGFNVVTKSVFDTARIKSLGWDISGSMYDKMLSTINERKNNAR